MAVRAPIPARLKVSEEEVYGVLSTAVDGAYYWAVNPDLAEPGLDPVRHYMASGWREGRDPAPWFSSRAYSDAYPEVARAGWNPFYHYLTVGRREGREVVRSSLAQRYLLQRVRQGEEPAWNFESLTGAWEAADAVAEEAIARYRERVLAETEFDAAFYLAASPDVAKTGIDPLDHFLAGGWREGRDPNPNFSVKDYLESYPDIAAADINPFIHYLRAGRAEGRTGRTELGFRYEIIKRLLPVDERVAVVARASARLKLGAAAALAKGLEGAKTGLADLHVTFSHDDYTANTGGVQLCLQREGARIKALGRDHLHLFPAKPWPVVRLRGEAGHLGVLLNGKPLGVFEPKVIACALARAAAAVKAGQRSFAIHSLLGHNAGETADILAAAGLKAGFFWLHDFASLCAGFHLLRNDVEDCSAPPPQSQACGICIYGPWRARHLAEHERLFERLSLTVVSPAQATLDLWKARSAYPTAEEVVLPHAHLVERGPAPAPPADRPLRIAYAGMPAAHKGWEVFRDLATRHAGDPRYHFLHLGGRTPPGLGIEFHKVTVTDARPRAMQEAIEALEADAVMIWPLCRETFSFIAYEAVAAGAAVITNPDSGNVAAFVEQERHGLVIAGEDALAAAFESGEIVELGRARRRPVLYDLAFSALTVDLLERVG
jgi:Glycosyl transferases group 1